MKFHLLPGIWLKMAAYSSYSVCDTIVTVMIKCLGYHSVSPNALLITCSLSNVILLVICIIIPPHAGITSVSHFPVWDPVDAAHQGQLHRTWKSVESGAVCANRDYPGKFFII